MSKPCTCGFIGGKSGGAQGFLALALPVAAAVAQKIALGTLR